MSITVSSTDYAEDGIKDLMKEENREKKQSIVCCPNALGTRVSGEKKC